MSDRSRRLIIHAGMHKTGSTAIQHWLHKNKQPNAHYFTFRDSNHSQMFLLMFEDKAHEFFSLANAGYTPERVMKERGKIMDDIRRQIVNSEDEVFVFSAERISLAKEEAVEAMYDFFRPLFPDIQVYAYARKPAGFMRSMFPQHLKAGKLLLSLKGLWPEYRFRFEKLMDVFGEDSVHIRTYDDVPNGDAVQDFMQWTGLTVPPEEDFRRNASMTATGMSLLYFYRRMIEPHVGEENRARYDDLVVETVRWLPGEAFDVNVGQHKPLPGPYAHDLAWMSARLGAEFSDLGQASRDEIMFENESEILKYAVAVSHVLVPQHDAEPLDPSKMSSISETINRFAFFLSHDFDKVSSARMWLKSFMLSKRETPEFSNLDNLGKDIQKE